MHGYDSIGMNYIPLHNGPPNDSLGHHPDSTDSYVTYLESDDSIPGSP